jgi:hypothetical protein
LRLSQGSLPSQLDSPMLPPRTPKGQPCAYERPLPLARGFSRRRLEVFSPKLGRRASFGSYPAWKIWLALEANPQVLSFCERPVYLPGFPGRMVDFWVQTLNVASGEFWLLRQPDADAANITEDSGTLPKQIFRLALRVIDPDTLRDWSVPVCWRRPRIEPPRRHLNEPHLVTDSSGPMRAISQPTGLNGMSALVPKMA